MKPLPEDPAELAQELGPEFSSRYEISGVLGRGGMGLVLRARQKDLKRDVAVKLMLVSDPDMLRRFQREGRLLAKLRHPNIVAVLATGEARGHPYLVFELVEGETLRSRIDRMGALKVDLAIGLVRQVADGLALAHEQGVLHRDVKCNNIIVTSDGTAKLADFGLALTLDAGDRITRAGIFMGTPEYTAPEVITGAKPQAASDLYSLGMVLYEALAGNTSFGDLPLQELMRAHLEREPLPLSSMRRDVPPWVDAIVRRLLAKDPAQRYQGAAQLVRLLDQGLAGKLDGAEGFEVPTLGRQPILDEVDATTVQATGTQKPRRKPRGRDRSPLASWKAAALGAGAGLVLLLAAVAAFWLGGGAGGIAITEVKLEPLVSASIVRWKTSENVQSWLEFKPESESAAAWRRAGVRERAPDTEHLEILRELAPGRSYQVRVACKGGAVSLAYPVGFVRAGVPSVRSAKEGWLLELPASAPVKGHLEIEGRRMEPIAPGPARVLSFRIGLEDALLGLRGLTLVEETMPGEEVRSCVEDCPGLPRELAAAVDLPAIGRILKELYGQTNAGQAARQQLFERVRRMPFFPLWQRFLPVSKAFFTELPSVPDSLKIEVYNKLLGLEHLDAGATDFHLPLLIGFWSATEPFVTRRLGQLPWKGRYRWSSDLTIRDSVWVPEGEGPAIKRMLADVKSFTTTWRTRALFRLRIPAAEYEQARGVALAMKVSYLVTRSYFEVTVNNGLRMQCRLPIGWDYDVSAQDRIFFYELPKQFLRPGDNRLEIAMGTSPGVDPSSHAEFWELYGVGR